MSQDLIIGKLWSACNKMRQDPGTTGSLQYIEQFSWLLFLKVYEEVENEHESKAAFENRKYERNIEGIYRWSKWSAKEKYLSGSDLLNFVDKKLFPYLKKLSGNRAKESIGQIFNSTQNRMEDGYLLREVIDIIGEADFFSSQETFAISNIYEGLFSRMKSADLKPLAEYYTPRVIAKFMTEMVNPKIGESVYDPANGPSGFLIESYHLMKPNAKSVKDHKLLQNNTFFGREIKSLPFILGMMNMVLNGIAEPNIVRGNTLAINLFNLSESDKYNVILTNPPFSGTLRGVSSNFPYPSSATEILFLQHCMRSLKGGGSCAIIVPDGVLFETSDKYYVNTRKELVESFNLHSIVRLPKGAFAPYAKDVSTNILFFDKAKSTKDIWYYEIPLDKNMKSFSKTRPIRDKHFTECKSLFKNRKESLRSWIVDKKTIASDNYNLDIINPNRQKDFKVLSVNEFTELFNEQKANINNILSAISKELISLINVSSKKKVPLADRVIESKDFNSDKRITDIYGVNNITGIEPSYDKKTGDIAKYKIIRKGYLAYNPYRINVGSVGLVNEEIVGIISPAYVICYADEKKLLPKFLLLYLKSSEGLHEIKAKTRGSVRSSLKFGKLQQIEIPDISVDEQKKIIDKFERIKTSFVSIVDAGNTLLNDINRTPIENF